MEKTAASAAKSLQLYLTVRPHRWQPTRLPRPWDSPGKNTGVGCHFLLQCMKVKSERSRSVMSDSLQPHGLQPTSLLHPWHFLGKSTGAGAIAFSVTNSLLQLKQLLHLPRDIPHIHALTLQFALITICLKMLFGASLQAN